MVPNFPIEVCLQDNKHLADSPLALIDSRSHPATEMDSSEIIALNSKATASGLLLNMTVAQGHIVCPHLEIRVRDFEQEATRSNGIYKKLQSLSPFIEEARTGLYFLDAAGFDLLYKDDDHLAKEMIATVKSEQCSFPIKLGLARNKFVAQVAADLTPEDSFSIVPGGTEQKFLRPLPIEHLRLPPGVLATLHDLGLKTIGQLATFPANEMIRRFGPQGSALSRLARGDDTAFFDPAMPSEPITQRIWLTAPIFQTATIIAHVKQLLSSLLDNQSCSMIEIVFCLENKTEQTIPITLEQPTMSVAMFVRQLRILIEQPSRALTSPVTGIKVTIPAVASLLTEQLQLETGAPAGTTNSNPPSKESILYNNDTITVVIRRNLYLPEQRFIFTAFSGKPGSGKPGSGPPPGADAAKKHLTVPYAACKITGLRLLQPPREINVTCDGTISGDDAATYPVTVAARLTEALAVKARGPWKLSGGWWSHRFDRLYWEVSTNHRQLYLIYLDRLSSRWFLQGIFD